MPAWRPGSGAADLAAQPATWRPLRPTGDVTADFVRLDREDLGQRPLERRREALLLENIRSVERVLCSWIASVKHNDSDAKMIEGLHIDRIKPESAVAIP
jgi:hypothetical protein